MKLRVVIAAVSLWIAAGVGWCQFSDVQETRLDNGLVVLTKEVHFAPLVAVQIYYNVGSRNEHNGITGVSHLIEHMNYRGTTEFAAQEVDRLLAEIGSPDSNGYTWLDNTSFYEKVPADQVDLVLRAEASRMRNALFRPEDFTAERTVVLSELEGDYNDPSERLNEETWAAAFMAHPYHHPVIGWRSDVENVTRDMAYDYYRANYVPNNAALVIVGDFETNFGSIARGPDPPRVYTVEPPQRGERRTNVKAAAASPQVSIVYHTPAVSDPDHIVLDVIGNALSTGRTGKLDMGIVEKGLATSVGVWNADLRDPALMQIDATLPARGEPETVVSAIQKIVDDLKTTPLTDEELARNRKQVRAAFVLANDSITDQATIIGDHQSIAGYEYLKTYLDKVNAVTADDVMRVAKAYLTVDNRTVGTLMPSGEEPAPGGGGGGRGAHYRMPPRVVPIGPYAPTAAIAAAGKPQAVRRVMPNGLVVIVYENHANPSVAICGTLRAGAIFDPADKPGLASFTAYMLDRGTTTRDWKAIGQQIDDMGASLSIEGRGETAGLTVRAMSEDLEGIITTAGDLLMNPTFPRDKLDQAREELLTALAEKQQDTYARAQLAVQQMLYPPDHPYYHDSAGTADSLHRIKRDDLVSFHRAHYRPDTLVLAVVGDVRADQVFAMVEKVFGGWKADGDPPAADLPAIGSYEAKDARIDLSDKTQADFAFGAPGLSRKDPDYCAAQIAATIVGGSEVSRLSEEIREKRGLAYYAYMGLDVGAGQGTVVAGAGTSPTNTKEAMDATRAVLATAGKGEFTDDEIRIAKGQWLGGTVNALDTNLAIAQSYCTIEYYGLGLDYNQRLPSIVKDLTTEQIEAAARKYFNPKAWVVAVAGPPSQSEK